MQDKKSERIQYLVELLNKASRAYYAKDEEIMSNFEYDKLYDELVALEEETGMVLSNSPTVNVGFEAVNCPRSVMQVLCCPSVKQRTGRNYGTG